jgi:hypothetical protein
MLQPRYSKQSSFIANPIVCHSLPTGKGFGGSNLQLDGDRFPVAQIAPFMAPIAAPQQLPLVAEFGKIVFLAAMFWCLLGINFCVNLIAAISNFDPPTPTTSIDRY